MTTHERKPRLRVRLQRPFRGWRSLQRIARQHRRATRELDTERGTRVVLFSEGRPAYEAMLLAIGKARRSIHLEIYQFESDGIGWRFARALMEKARAGVAVRVVYDAVGSLFATAAMWVQLEAAGAEVHCYHPLAPWRPGWTWNRRDHRKILVVDGRVGFAGGMNISDEHLPVEEGGGGWRDTHVRLEGPAVADLQLVFFQTWVRVGGSHPATAEAMRNLFRARHFDDGVPVRVVSNRTFRSRRTIRNSVIRAIENARETVHLTHAYFVPDPGLGRALKEAVRRGVEVHLIVPARSDVALALAAGRGAQTDLVAHGIRVSRRLGRVLHAKIAVVDGRWVSIGSSNFNYRSFLHNQEVNVEIRDEGFGGQMEALFQSDLAQSAEVTLGDLQARPLIQKILDTLAYAMRFWV